MRSKHYKVSIRTFTHLVFRYEKYERVDNGDFNWVTPHFIAFASPIQKEFSSSSSTIRHEIEPPFARVLDYFSENAVGLVVRLNSVLYDRREFEDLGIDHVEMEFEDGTCPELNYVKRFISLAERAISEERMLLSEIEFDFS